MGIWQWLGWVVGLPTEPGMQPEKLAEETFCRLEPDEQVAWTRLAADEPERFVVGVFYGATTPPSYRFFAVSKENGQVTQLVDDSAYRPKVWR